MGLLVAGAVGIVRDVACVACISRGVVCVACIVRRVRRMYCPSRASLVSLFAGGRSQNDCRMQGQIAVGEIADDEHDLDLLGNPFGCELYGNMQYTTFHRYTVAI